MKASVASVLQLRPWVVPIYIGLCIGAPVGCSKTNSPETDSNPSASAAKAAATTTRWQWTHGASHIYELELSSTLGLGQGKTLVSFDMSGNVDLSVRELDNKTHHFLMSIPDAEFSQSSMGEKTDFHKLAAELADPFGFTVESGKLKNVQVNPLWSTFAASIARTVAAMFQLPVLPEVGNGAAWKTEEVDSTGEYEAEYSIVPGGLAKKKLGYQRLKLGQLQLGTLKTAISPEIVSSKGTFEFSSSGTPRSIVYSENIDTPMGQAATLSSRTKLTLKFSKAGETKPVSYWKQALAEARQLDASAPYTESIRTNYDELRIGDYTYQTALTEIRQQNMEDEKVVTSAAGTDAETERRRKQRRLQAHARVFRAMAAILRNRPEHIKDAVSEIKKKTSASRTMIDALAMADAPESMKALVSLVNDKTLDEEWRGACARGLIRVKHANPQSVAALTALLDEPRLRVHAIYGLGSIARRLDEEGKSEDANRIVHTLVLQLEKERSDTAIAQTLRGISNAGLASALGAVTPYLKAPAENVRGAAVTALRLMSDPRVDALIVDALLRDPKKAVRREAAEAAELRESTDVLIAGLQNAVTSDPDAKVRRKVLDILISWLPDHPELEAALRTVEQQDKRPSIRRTASDALATHRAADSPVGMSPQGNPGHGR